MEIRQLKNGLSLVPETQFEADVLAHMFVGNEQRKVVVKSGSSISDIMSVDILVSNEKTYITDQAKCKCDEKVIYPGSILDMLEKAGMRS